LPRVLQCLLRAIPFVAVCAIITPSIPAISSPVPAASKSAITAVYAAQDRSFSRRDMSASLALYRPDWSGTGVSGGTAQSVDDRHRLLDIFFSWGGPLTSHTAILGITQKGNIVTAHVSQHLKAEGTHPLDRFIDYIDDEDWYDDWKREKAGWRIVRSRKVLQKKDRGRRTPDPEADRQWLEKEGLEALPATFDGVWDMAFSPDGRYLAIDVQQGGGLFHAPQREVEIWDVASRQKVASLPEDELLFGDLTFSPDGTQLAASSATDPFAAHRFGYVTIFDTKTWKQKSHWKVDGTGISSVAYSPDGRRLASGCADCRIILWDTESGKQIKTLGHAEDFDGLGAHKLSYSADGIIAGANNLDFAIWKVDTGELVSLPEAATSVALSPDGKTVAAGGEYTDGLSEISFRPGQVAFYNISDWEKSRLYTWPYSDSQADIVGWTPNGKTAIFHSAHTIVAWNLQGNSPKILVEDLAIGSVELTRDATLMAVTIDERDQHVYLKKLADRHW